MRRLLEGVLDLETKAINAHDLHGVERQVGRYQHDGPPRWVNNRDEAHKLPDRAPQEIAHAIDGVTGLAPGRLRRRKGVVPQTDGVNKPTESGEARSKHR